MTMYLTGPAAIRIAFSGLLMPCCLVALIFADSPSFFIGGGVLLWLLGFFCVQKDNFVAKFYWLIFGVFFVVPVVMLGGESYVYQGALLKDIRLDQGDVLIFSKIIFLFLLFFLLTSVVCSGFFEGEVESFDIRNKKLFSVLLTVSMLVVVVFNLVEMNAIYNQGYVAFQKGEVVVKKGFLVLLFEVLFFVLVALGFSLRDKRSFLFLMIYSMTSMFTGVRMPGATLAFFGVLYFFPYWRKRLVIVIFFMLLLSPPLLMFSQALRVYGYSAIDYFDFWYGYYDLINVLGYTVDTLKAAVAIGDESGFAISPFFKPLHVLSVFMERVLQVEFRFSFSSFGPELTKYYALDLYERTGTTFGSSSIAEAWYYGRYFGVAFLGVVSFCVASFFSKLAYRNTFLGSLIFLVIVPKFVMSVRNEVLGWFFESLIFLGICIPFVVFCYVCFVGGERSGLERSVEAL